MGAVLVARERGRTDPGYGARGAGEGQPRVLGAHHAAVRLFARVQARARRELGAREARGARAHREWRRRHAPERLVERAELGRRGAQARRGARLDQPRGARQCDLHSRGTLTSFFPSLFFVLTCICPRYHIFTHRVVLSRCTSSL